LPYAKPLEDDGRSVELSTWKIAALKTFFLLGAGKAIRPKRTSRMYQRTLAALDRAGWIEWSDRLGGHIITDLGIQVYRKVENQTPYKKDARQYRFGKYFQRIAALTGTFPATHEETMHTVPVKKRARALPEKARKAVA
jgi:hypothetical protein